MLTRHPAKHVVNRTLAYFHAAARSNHDPDADLALAACVAAETDAQAYEVNEWTGEIRVEAGEIGMCWPPKCGEVGE